MKKSFYSKYIKRLLDIICALLALIVFCWLYAIIAILVRIKLGKPVLYTATRIGKDNKPFKLYKFRSMTDAKDENGNLLPDTERLTSFGRKLRSTSLDEIAEAINILKGEMSVVGPRPLPSIYLPYYTEEELKRHSVKPGLSGWAQVNGRNSLTWDEKFKLDVWYAENVSFVLDVKIVFLTVVKALKRENIGQGEEAPGSLHVERAGKEYR